MEVGGERRATQSQPAHLITIHPGVGNWLSLGSNGKRWIGEDTTHGSLFNRRKKQYDYSPPPHSLYAVVFFYKYMLCWLRTYDTRMTRVDEGCRAVFFLCSVS